MAESDRFYPEWLKRWNIRPRDQRFPLFDGLQPTVIVDDVRDLHLPPVVANFGARALAAAVVAEFSTIALQPVNKAILIMEIDPSVVIQFGVIDAAAPAGVTTATPAQKLEGGTSILPTALLFRGSTVAATLPATAPRISGGDITALGTIVIPGQTWIAHHSVVNVAVDLTRIMWAEFPAPPDAIGTSLPNAG